MTEPTDPRPGKYRRRPTTIEAIRWDGTDESIRRLRQWCGKGPDDQLAFVAPFLGPAQLYVAANDSFVNLPVGQWVAKDDQGFYPIADEQFAKTYDLVVEPPPRSLLVALDRADAVMHATDPEQNFDVVYTTEPTAALTLNTTLRRYVDIQYTPRARHGRYIDAIAEAAETRRAIQAKP